MQSVALYTRIQLLRMYRQMLQIRFFEEKAAEMYVQGKISGFSHLYIGQEAIAVGVAEALADKDYMITAYREHGQALAKGCDPKEVMAELFGKATGLCGGRGGSMHLFDAEKRFMGGFAIVAGQMPIATGLALSVAYRGEDTVVACLFGDGAVNEGAFHESLNLAKLWNLPVLFICENNRYGMGTPVHRATALADITRHGCAYGLTGVTVNGMDVLAVYETTRQLVRQIRAGQGPQLLEACTFRFRGHSMADPLKYRTPQEEEIWKARDPIPSLANKLAQEGMVDEPEMEAIRKSVTQEVEAAVAFAEESPFPPVESLMDDLYVENEAIDSTGRLRQPTPTVKPGSEQQAKVPEPEKVLSKREQREGQE
jgi:pyruvate dehydrogenase E1 component alpha subunit